MKIFKFTKNDLNQLLALLNVFVDFDGTLTIMECLSSNCFITRHTTDIFSSFCLESFPSQFIRLIIYKHLHLI